MIRAVEKVRERLYRAVDALETAEISYAVVGDNAVEAWISRIDESAVRTSQDVEILLDRCDFEDEKSALINAGVACHQVDGVEMFFDSANIKRRHVVRLVYAQEPATPHDASRAPSIADVDASGPFRVIGLEALARMKLTTFRALDRTHLRDMIEVGLIDASWPARLAPELGARLQTLLDNPDG
jgi:hypothetical protein